MPAARPLLAVAAACAAVAAHAQPITYTINPEHTFVYFEVVHFNTSTSRGRFGPGAVSGSVVIDRTAGRGEASVRVATAGVSTGIPVFDAVLRGADLLSSSAYPEAYFVARTVRLDGPMLSELRGEFTLRGVSQGLTLSSQLYSCSWTEAAVETCNARFVGEFSRSEFGITHSLPFVADRVRLEVRVEATAINSPPRPLIPPLPAR